MTADPHDLIPAVLREFGEPKTDLAQELFATARLMNEVAAMSFQAGATFAPTAENTDKPTRAELLTENAQLQTDRAQADIRSGELGAELIRALAALAAAKRYSGDEIVTEYWQKPVTERNCVWSAHRRDYEPGQPLGHGSTELAAITELLEQEEERDE